MDNTLKIVAGGVHCDTGRMRGISFGHTPAIRSNPSSEFGPSVQGNVTVYFFYGEECPHCHNVMPFIR